MYVLWYGHKTREAGHCSVGNTSDVGLVLILDNNKVYIPRTVITYKTVYIRITITLYRVNQFSMDKHLSCYQVWTIIIHYHRIDSTRLS